MRIFILTVTFSPTKKFRSETLFVFLDKKEAEEKCVLLNDILRKDCFCGIEERTILEKNKIY